MNTHYNYGCRNVEVFSSQSLTASLSFAGSLARRAYHAGPELRMAKIGHYNPNTRQPLVLGIESTCDESAVAIVEASHTILSHSLMSQWALHQPYKGENSISF
jgi:hypothetical protein